MAFPFALRSPAKYRYSDRHLLMSEKPKYDFWLHWNVSQKCMMGCSYCEESANLPHGPVNRIDIPRLIAALDRTGLVFRVSFTGGGEPFLVPNLPEACVELTKKHYVTFNTNMAERNVRKLLEQIDPARVTYVYASCHFDALKRRNLLDLFLDNCRLCRERGIPLSICEVADPALRDRVPEMRAYFEAQGFQLFFSPFCGESEGKSYPAAYTGEDLDLFTLSSTEVPFYTPNEAPAPIICNAGCTAAVVSPTGDVFTCDRVPEHLGSVYDRFTIKRQMITCPAEQCFCPLHLYDTDMYQRAVRRDRLFRRFPGPLLDLNDRLNRFEWYSRLKRLFRQAHNPHRSA